MHCMQICLSLQHSSLGVLSHSRFAHVGFLQIICLVLALNLTEAR